MKMIRRGGAASGSVVEECPGGTEISDHLEKGADMFSNGLAAMVQMGEGEVRRKDGPGVAEDQVVASPQDTFLAFRQTVEAEETGLLSCSSFVRSSRCILKSSGIVMEADGELSAADVPFLHLLKRFVAFPELLPGISLLRQEFETESG